MMWGDMAKRVLHIFLIFILATCVSCGSSLESGSTNLLTSPGSADGTTYNDEDGEEPETVGTIVNTPAVMIGNIFPHFDDHISTPTFSAPPRTEHDDATPNTQQSPNKVKGFWLNHFATGPIMSIQAHYSDLELLGLSIVEEMKISSIASITDTPQTIYLPTHRIMNTVSPWKVDMVLDKADPDYIRFSFINTTTGIREAVYIVHLASDSTEVLTGESGIFAYVNPQLLNLNPEPGLRYVSLTYNFKNPLESLMLLRTDHFDDASGYFYALQFHQQCNASTDDCSGENLEISTQAPDRIVDAKTHLRFDWNNATGVCLGPMGEAGNTPLKTVYLDSDGSTTVDGCILRETNWSEQIIVADDLVFRYDDTDPLGGTALQYFLDGYATEGWDSLIPSLIPTQLDATNFE